MLLVGVPKVSLQVPGLIVLYLYHPRVDRPFGLIFQLSVAVVVVTAVAGSVVTIGDVSKQVREPPIRLLQLPFDDSRVCTRQLYVLPEMVLNV